MTDHQKNIIVSLLSLLVGALLAACFVVPVTPNNANELQALQIERVKLSIKVLKAQLNKKNLTTDDLEAIYTCVDLKIKNQSNKVKFPCVSVRGDSF